MDHCKPAVVFIAIIGRTRIAYWVISGFLIILALISGVKLKILGVPLTPWDLVVAGEASDMVKYLSNILTLNVLSVILLFLVGSYFILYRTTMFIKKVGIKRTRNSSWNWFSYVFGCLHGPAFTCSEVVRD